jgi:O-antigen ligase
MLMKSKIIPALTGLLIAASFGISLFFEGAQSYVYAPALFCLLAGLLITCTGCIWKPFEISKAAPAWLMLAFWLYVTISLLWSTTPFPSLVTYLVFSCLPLSFFVLLLSPRRKAFIEASGVALHLALTVLGLWALAQVTVLHAQFPGRAGHPLLDPNNFAALMNLGLLPMLTVAITAAPSVKTKATMASAVILFGALTATESRGGMLCFLICGGVLIFLMRERLQTWRTLAILGCMAALFAGLSVYSHTGGTAARIASFTAIQSDDSAMNRPVLWKATTAMIAERPLTGTGFGSFYLTYASNRPVADKWSAGQWAHNDPLQFAAEMGIAAPLLFYAFILSLLWRTRKALEHQETKTDDRALMIGPLLGFIAVVLHAHIEFQFYVMPILVVSGVWLAAWYSRTADAMPPVLSWQGFQAKGAQKLIIAVSIFAIAGLFAVPAARGAMATYYLMQAVNTMRQDGHPKAYLATLDKADAWAPGSFVDAKVQRAALYLDLLNTPEGIFSEAEQKAMANYVLSTLSLAEATVPFWSDINSKRATLYMEMKSKLDQNWQQKAENELRIAIRKNPLDLGSRARLIEALMARGQAEQAYELLQDGLARPHSVEDEKDMLALQTKLKSLVDLKHQYKTLNP